jgi:hypothetical protein
MQVIRQNVDAIPREWSTLPGRRERRPEMVKGFGQEGPAAFQQSDREEEGAARDKGADISRHKSGLTQLPKAGGLSFYRPKVTEGGMPFAFPPYAQNRDQ